MKILILCTGNSCRSQMAHGFLQSLDSRLQVFSAGTQPAARVHPLAVQAMQEAGIDLGEHRPTGVEHYVAEPWDYVITVCGGAKESCPHFMGRVEHRLHLGFEDPSEAVGSEAHRWREFLRVRNAIRERFVRLYQEELLPKLSTTA